MIYLTRLDGTEVVVNCDLIATIEKTPDTMITMINGQHLLVREPVEEVVERSIGYRHRVYRGPGLAMISPEPAPPPMPAPEKKEGD
jgi:flagellar protein FlbD